MKPGACALSVAILAFSSVASAAETTADVESDHLDAYDEGGPRSLGLLVDPASVFFGSVGAELDLRLSDLAALTLEGDWFGLGSTTTGYDLVAGVVLYPWRLPFHGLYVHPQLEGGQALSGGALADFAGAGATLGWQWTLPCGFTFRLGGGAMFEHVVWLAQGAAVDVASVRPLADGTVGWLF